MKVKFNVFNPDIDLEEEITTYFNRVTAANFKFSCEHFFWSFSVVSQYNYLVNELNKHGVDKTKLVYYGLRFMYERISTGDIDPILDVQKLPAPFDFTHSSELKAVCGTNVDILYDYDTQFLLESLGKGFNISSKKDSASNFQLGINVLLSYIINESAEFIDYVCSHKMAEFSYDLNIYWSLRYNKLKEYYVKNKYADFDQAFNMYLLSKQLPSSDAFKDAYNKIKNNYVSINTVLKNWKRHNKKLLSCYINDDEKQYLEFMLLSNTVNYKELEKFIYNK